MKKKVFSKLLMVALVATVGAFTSCKDYDDDINDLRSKVDGLNTSLTTLINDKAALVQNQVTLLEQQLAKVEDAYKAADAEFQKELTAAKETGKANADAIKTLQAEVVNLQTAKGQLEEAVKALQDGLATANANIKANGDEIIKLIAADKALEDKIATAQAAADNALKEAQAAQTKAGENATEIASLKTKEQGDFDNLQNQITKNLTDVNAKIAENLTTVNAKIAEVNKALGDRITVNETDIKALQDASASYKTDIKNINDKITALEKSDKDILDALDKAQKKLEQADADAAAEQKKVNEKLAAEIKANADAIDLINHVTLRDLEDRLVDEVIPAEVLKQLNGVLSERLKKFFEEDVTTLVTTETAKNKTLIDALGEKVDSIDSAINVRIDAQFVLACKYADEVAKAKGDSIANVKGEQLKKLFMKADTLLNDSIDKVAAALEAAKTTLGDNIATINTTIGTATTATAGATGMFAQIESLESYFNDEVEYTIGEGDAAQTFTVSKLENSLLKSSAVLASLKALVDAANGEINTMITSINLYANQHQAQDNGTRFDGFDHDLTFTYAIEKENVFPAANLQKFVDSTIVFSEGMFRSYADSVLVRVSPTNAILTKENIALLNSQGENIVANGTIEVQSVERYARPEGQYITRANENTGLWVIKFKMVDTEIGNKFKEASTTYVNGQARQILYAVAAKNTVDQEGQARYAVSEYDLGLRAVEAYHAWDFNVNEETVAKIFNRYVQTDLERVQSDETDEDQIDPENGVYFINELTWDYSHRNFDNINECRSGSWYVENKTEVADYLGYTSYTEGEGGNAVDRYNHNNIGYPDVDGIDNRSTKEILAVNYNQAGTAAEITIDFPAFTSCTRRDIATPVAGFYVTLDQDFALESHKSEVNSWRDYQYENVGYYYTHEGEIDGSRTEDGTGIVKAHLFTESKGTIKIFNKHNVKGDVIGFRVYAVNLDGTLYDPDGRAFYVKIGDPAVKRSMDFIVTATEQSGSWDITTPKNQISGTEGFFKVDKNGTYSFDINWAEGNPVVRGANYHSSVAGNYHKYEPLAGYKGYSYDGQTRPTYNLIRELFQFEYTDDATITDDTQWYDEPTYKTKNARAILLAADRILNDTTYKMVLTVTKREGTVDRVVNEIAINVKKVMPTDLPKAFKVVIGKEGEVAKTHFYLRPATEYSTWDISPWFTNDEDQVSQVGQFGFGRVSNLKWSSYWTARARTTRSQGVDNYFNVARGYRWAQDVRPYNFEEDFVGLENVVNNQRVYDPNYKFVFPGAGKFNYQEQDDAASDFTADAISLYRDYMHDAISFIGLDELLNPGVTMKPAYYLPLVYYAMQDTAYFNHLKDVVKVGDDYLLPVKAGYTYRNVSLTLDEDGNFVGNNSAAGFNDAYNWIIEPGYFDTDGRLFDANGAAITAANAAFKCDFTCAIDDTFTPGFRFKATEFKQYKPQNDTWVDAQISVPSGQKADEIGTKAANPVPYGIGFTVYLDSIGVDWVSGRAAYTQEEATGASYFMTEFDQITSIWTSKSKTAAALNKDKVKYKVDENGKSYYTDSLAILQPTVTDYGSYNGFLFKNNKGKGDFVNWVALAGLTDPIISEVVINKADGTTETLNKKKGNLNRINDYFTITKTSGLNAGKYGLKFQPHTNALNPNDVKKLEIKLSSSAKIVHQWAHSQDISSSSFSIFWGDPNTSDNLSRRTR